VLATDAAGAVVQGGAVLALRRHRRSLGRHRRPDPEPPFSGPAKRSSKPRPACTRTGCATTIRPRDATSRSTRWGWWTGRACMGMRGNRRCGTERVIAGLDPAI